MLSLFGCYGDVLATFESHTKRSLKGYRTSILTIVVIIIANCELRRKCLEVGGEKDMRQGDQLKMGKLIYVNCRQFVDA